MEKIFTKRHFFNIGTFLYCLCLFFCSSSSLFSQSVKIPDESPAEQLRKALSSFGKQCPERSIVVYSKSVEKLGDGGVAMADFCASCGFNLVHLAASPERLLADSAYASRIRDIVKNFHNKGMKVSALFLNDCTPIVKPEKGDEAAKAILAFNSESATSGGAFDSLTADLEPNMLRQGSLEAPKGFSPVWNSNHGWKDGSNVKLLALTVKALKSVKVAAPGMKLFAFYGMSWTKPEAQAEGSGATVKDFLSACDSIIVMAYAGKPKKVLSMANRVFKLADDPSKVSICVKVRFGAKADSFGSSGWNSMIGEFYALQTQLHSSPLFNGIGVYEFEGLSSLASESGTRH